MIISKYFKRYSLLFFTAILFLGIETFADLMQPMLIAKLIDEGILKNDMNQIFYFGSLMLGATVLGLVGALMRNWISSHVSFSFAKDLRGDLYRKLLTLPMLKAEAIERGSLITRLTSDVSMLQQFVNGMMRIFLKAPLLAIGSFIMVYQLDRKFVGIYLFLVPVTFVIIFLNLKLGYPLYKKIQEVLDRLNLRTMAFLSGIRTVKAFNRFDYEKSQFNRISGDLKDVTTKTMQTMAIFSPIIMFLINFGIVVVLFFSRKWVSQGTISVGQVVAFINYMTQFYFAMSIISRIFNVFVKAKTSDERIKEVFDSESVDNPSYRDLGPLEGGLTFKNVSFHYGQGQAALKDFSFSIKDKETIGILGATGSGKTTLVHMVNGLLSPTEGEIEIGGMKIDTLSKKSLSDHVAYVPQKSILFSGTILDNLSFGKRGLEEKAYYKALEDASAGDFIQALENGIHTVIGKDGVNISGGQKQRLAIARALVSDPQILILDDSTSAVDVLTERKIKDSIKKRKVTTLVVGQKITTVMDMDRIMVVDQGRLVAFDTHEVLLRENDLYQAIYEAEFGGRNHESYTSK